MSYPAELLEDDLAGLLAPQRAPRSGFQALGALLGGGIDRQGAFMAGQLRSAKTQDAIERARLSQRQAGIAGIEYDALNRLATERPDVYASGYNPIDLILGQRGDDYANAALGRLRNQEYGFRNELGDELAPPAARQAAGDAVKGDFQAFVPVGSDAYYDATNIAGGVQPVPAPQGSLAQQKRTPVGYRYKADGNLEFIPGGPADPKGPRAAIVTKAPVGYRYGPDGRTLQYIPGGPADPTGPNAVKASQQLRKEFNQLGTVKDFKTVLPLIESAYNAPDDGFGDLELIYTAGKVLDPGSVVREGELALTIKSGSPIERLLGTVRFYVGAGGRLTPETRAQLVNMLETRREAIQQQYELDYDTYADYATQAGFDPKLLVGPPADSAFPTRTTTQATPRATGGAPPRRTPDASRTTAAAPVRINSPEELAALPSGTQFVAPDGSVRRKP